MLCSMSSRPEKKVRLLSLNENELSPTSVLILGSLLSMIYVTLPSHSFSNLKWHRGWLGNGEIFGLRF